MDQTPPTIDAPPPVPQSPSTSLGSRLVNVFAAPGEVFDEVRTSPVSAANWVLPTILLAIVAMLSALIINSQPAIKRQKVAMQEAMFQKMVDSGKMSKEAADKQVAAAESGGAVKSVIEAAFAPVGIVIALFWSALIVWLGGLILGTRFGYMKAVEIVGLASMIALLGAVVKTLLIMVTGNMFAGPTPGLLVKDFNPMSNTLHGILSVCDVIWFWALGVQAYGLAKVGGISFGKAAVWVGGVWLVLVAGLFVIGIVFKRMMGF